MDILNSSHTTTGIPMKLKPLSRSKVRRLAAVMLRWIAADIENISELRAGYVPRKEAAIADFLERMSKLFSRHICGDFMLSAVFPEREDRHALVQDFHNLNGDPEEYQEGSAYEFDLDWCLMWYVATRLGTPEAESREELLAVQPLPEFSVQTTTKTVDSGDRVIECNILPTPYSVMVVQQQAQAGKPQSCRIYQCLDYVELGYDQSPAFLRCMSQATAIAAGAAERFDEHFANLQEG